MNVLALDTASPEPGVCLLAGGVLFEEPLPGDRQASEKLLSAIARCLERAAIPLSACHRIAVCSGPGPFTGLRIELSTAWGLGVRDSVEGCPTLACLLRRRAVARRDRHGPLDLHADASHRGTWSASRSLSRGPARASLPARARPGRSRVDEQPARLPARRASGAARLASGDLRLPRPGCASPPPWPEARGFLSRAISIADQSAAEKYVSGTAAASRPTSCSQRHAPGRRHHQARLLSSPGRASSSRAS
jgi:hypothetical protein